MCCSPGAFLLSRLAVLSWLCCFTLPRGCTAAVITALLNGLGWPLAGEPVLEEIPVNNLYFLKGRAAAAEPPSLHRGGR